MLARYTKLAVVAAVVVGLLALAPAALADTVTIKLTGPINTSTNPVVNGVFVGPYAATVNGVSMQLICDDYDHHVSVGDVWTANVSTFADLSHTRFWNSGNTAQSLKNYQMAAWLSMQLLMSPKSVWGDIHYAMWRIFSVNAPNVGNSTYWLNLAASQDFSTVDFSNVKIYTPINPTAPQEYIVVTPEPASLALLGTGFVMAGSFLRRKYFKANRS